MEEKKSYQEKAEVLMRELGAKIGELKARADKSGTDIRAKLHEEIKVLRSKEEGALNKLRELKGAGEGKWEGLKGGVEHALGDLKKTFDDTVARFKK